MPQLEEKSENGRNRSISDYFAWKPGVNRLKSFENAKQVLEIKNIWSYQISKLDYLDYVTNIESLLWIYCFVVKNKYNS